MEPFRPSCTRSCFQMSEPEHDGSNGEHRQVVDRAFLVAGRDAPELLQTVDQPLYDIPLAIGSLIEPDAPFSFLPSNHDANPSATQLPPDLPAAVALVSRYPIRSRPWPSSPSLDCPALHQGLEHDLLMALSGGQQQDHRLARPFSPDMDLGAKASLASSQPL